MRHLCTMLLCLGLVPQLLADAADLKEARQRWLKGNYEEARALFQKHLKDANLGPAAAVGVSRSWASEGEYDQALKVVDAALAQHDKSPALLARRAELLHGRGRWQEAEAAAEKAIALDKDQFQARWVRAQIYRDRGEFKKADLECRWFVRTYSTRSANDDDIKDPEQLLLVGLAGAENARWHNISDQFRVILNDVWGDAGTYDKDFWPAEYQAGMLLLEKYNRPEAIRAFDKCLKINPSAAEALVGKGLLALQKYDINEAEQFAERALKINPKLPEALHLRADLHLLAGDVGKAMQELATARTLNPRDERTLGRVAACLFIQRKQADFAAVVKETTTNNPTPGLFYYELAERLEARRFYDDAEGFYKEAIKLWPALPWPHNSLGLLLLRMGREPEAHALLKKAFAADRFNVRVLNSLKVLDHLGKYETIKTPHFTLRFDPKTDRILARYMAEELEVMHAELAKKFAYEPKESILVEVFNNHEMFSGRVVALPDLHTIGASTGRMFAMVSPQGKGVGKPFNWSRVLRHELVHVFNLEQTNFQCPHWLTEGLAVIHENVQRPPSWNELLLEKVPKGELLTLDTINLGFIRPRSPTEWHQAYCQSQLYVEYMTKTHGPQTVNQLLLAYRDGLDTDRAIAQVCKVDKATFEKGYVAYLQGVVKALKGRPAEKPQTLAQLREAHEKNPDDLDTAARLAEQYADRGRNVDARKLADAVLEKKKLHPLANYVRARLVLLAGDEGEARRLLEAALDPKDPEPKMVQLLGKLYFDNQQLDKAAAMFELGRQTQPAEPKWLTELIRVAAQTNDRTKQAALLQELIKTNYDDFEQRKRLARMLLDDGKYAAAEQIGREALEINILDAAVQDIVLKALEEQKKNTEAAKLRKLLER